MVGIVMLFAIEEYKKHCVSLKMREKVIHDF